MGRHKGSGAPLGGRHEFEKPRDLPPDSHVHVARSGKEHLLRRGYDTADGLLLLAYMRDPRRQFVPLMQRLADHDALHPHTRHVGSAVFAIPPGAKPKSFIAQPLL